MNLCSWRNAKYTLNTWNVLHVWHIISKLQVCFEEFSDIGSCLFCGCLDDKKPEPLSSFRISKNEASVYGKHTGPDEDQRFPWWWSILPRQWAASLFENLTQVLRSVGDWRQQGEGRLPWPRQQCLWTAWLQAGPEAATARGSSWQPGNLLSPLYQPGPERARGQGERGRQPLPAKQTCSLHIHFIKTNVFLEFLLASCCLFLVGLTVRTEVNWPVSERSTEKYGAFQDNSTAVQACV